MCPSALTEDLHFNMSWFFNKLLHKQRAIAESRQRFRVGPLVILLKFLTNRAQKSINGGKKKKSAAYISSYFFCNQNFNFCTSAAVGYCFEFKNLPEISHNLSNPHGALCPVPFFFGLFFRRRRICCKQGMGRQRHTWGTRASQGHDSICVVSLRQIAGPPASGRAK